MIKLLFAFFYFSFLLFIACKNPSRLHYKSDSSKYELVKKWPQFSDNFLLGNPTGIGIDTNQHIFIFKRGERTWPVIGSIPNTYIPSKTILELDQKTGKILNSWGDSMFIMPHGLTVDANNNVWVTDVGLHQVFKFSHEGGLLLKIGKAKVSGNDATHFNKPTDIAVAKDGSFYVSDGYGNSRVIKFSAAGKYLFEWGKKGSKAGEFNIPHAITLDDKQNVYVADRENNRIQVFDPSGKFMKQWTRSDFGRICSITFNKEKNNFIAVDDETAWFNLQHKGSDIILFDSAGNVMNKFGKEMFKKNGIKCWYHDVGVDNQGNIYVEDILGNKIQKFEKASKK